MNCSMRSSSTSDLVYVYTPLSVLRFLVAVVTYVVVGVLVMKYRKGAQGVELIPNYHFWKDFPFLVKVSCSSVQAFVHVLLYIVLYFYVCYCILLHCFCMSVCIFVLLT